MVITDSQEEENIQVNKKKVIYSDAISLLALNGILYCNPCNACVPCGRQAFFFCQPPLRIGYVSVIPGGDALGSLCSAALLRLSDV